MEWKQQWVEQMETGATVMSSIDNSRHISVCHKIVSRVITKHSHHHELFASEEFH